ncbi:MAG TPA: Gfo/Idh/MocA family oxidoreductase [Tepidisphaeraceae bacterium]|jgi:predicted dehydrogenase
MSNRLRWGILGTGNIAKQFSTGVNASARGQLAGVGSRSADAAAAFAANYHIPAAHGSYDALLADRTVDAVYISLPNSLHRQWTIQALRAGKHVLCEKPFAANAAEAQEMFDVADKAGRMLTEAFMYRTHPLTAAVKAEVDRGTIGELRLIRTSFCFRVSNTQNNIRFSTELAGGVLMDVGCYCINFSRFFAGAEPAAVHADAHLHPSGVDDIATGTLRFPGGLLASFTCGMSVQADNTAYLCGSEGFIEIPIPWKPPARGAQYVIARGIPPRMDLPPLSTTSAGSPQAAAGATPPSPPLPPREVRIVDAGMDLYGVEADAFAAVVQDGAPAAVTAADTLGNMRVLDALRKMVGVPVG